MSNGNPFEGFLSKVGSIFGQASGGDTREMVSGFLDSDVNGIDMKTLIPWGIAAIGLLGGASSQNGFLSKMWGGAKGAVISGLLALILTHAANYILKRGQQPGADVMMESDYAEITNE